MVRDGARQAAQAWIGRCVAVLKDEGAIVLSQSSRALDHLVDGGAQAGEPVSGDRVFEDQAAVFEKAVALAWSSLRGEFTDIVGEHRRLLAGSAGPRGLTIGAKAGEFNRVADR